VNAQQALGPEVKVKRWLAILLVALVTVLALLRPEIGDDPLPQASFTVGTREGNCLTTTGSHTALDRRGEFSVLVWNIHKQTDGPWPEELWLKGKAVPDLMLLQEVQDDPGLLMDLTKQGYAWLKMGAFRWQGHQFGVMSAALAKPIKACGWLATEPWLRLPKSALLGLYPLSNGRTLLAVNLHGINFDFALPAWQQQIKVLLEAIAGHKGPVIFAGDFNSWGTERSRWLSLLMTTQGLKAVDFAPDKPTQVWGASIDHVYYRGLALEFARAPVSKVSDHSPLWVQFSLVPESANGDEMPNAHQ